MKKEATHIECPKCKTKINVNEILYNQLQTEIKKQYDSKLSDQQKEFDEKYSEIQKEKDAIKKMKSAIGDEIEKGINAKMTAEKAKIEKRLRDQITNEKSDEIKSIQEQLDQKIKDTRELNKVKADFAKIQREKDELKEKIEAEAEQKINQKIEEERLRIRKELEDKNQLKVSEKEYVIQQLKDQLKEAQRKIEQGSMQTQGEVQENAIDEYLKVSFPLDSIVEIKKGAKGGDSLQVVNSRTKQNHGSIYYESKRTKDFQPSWIEKFKKDMQEKGATFGVLVTDAYPKEMERLSQKDGIWICSFDEFKGLCYVLRESVILLDAAICAQENKGGKMEMLYEFLTGNEFRMQIEAIVEGFSQMQNDLTKEKRAMDSIWKQREKQIQKVILNTVNMYGSIKGIAGNAIGTIQALELPAAETENKTRKDAK